MEGREGWGFYGFYEDLGFGWGGWFLSLVAFLVSWIMDGWVMALRLGVSWFGFGLDGYGFGLKSSMLLFWICFRLWDFQLPAFNGKFRPGLEESGSG